MDTKKSNKKRICLALQGGGAHGAFTWGVLDKLLEDNRLEIDAISATSAGSLNAVILAYGMAIGGNQGARVALNDFWSTVSEYSAYLSPIRQVLPEQLSNLDIFANMSFAIFDFLTRTSSPYLFNPLNFNLLRLILLDKINFEKLRDSGTIKLFLCATNVKTGQLKVFEKAEISVDAVLASSCLPDLYQAEEINGEFYWDGGFIGNPPIFPLIYNSKVNDILIIHTNPIVRNAVPTSHQEISNRINEISFNSSMLREIRAISFVTSLLEKGWIKDEYEENIQRKFTHMIRSDKLMDQFNSLLNKFKWRWDFLNHLRDLGHEAAEDWLNENFDHIGKKCTINFNEFL